jgi:hypothetical protein
MIIKKNKNKENYLKFILPIEQKYLENMEKKKNSIPRSSVSSSNIYSVGYDISTRRLDVQFLNNPDFIYRYLDVEQEIYEEMIESSSVGRYYIKYIRGQYTCEKIEATEDDLVSVND